AERRRLAPPVRPEIVKPQAHHVEAHVVGGRALERRGGLRRDGPAARAAARRGGQRHAEDSECLSDSPHGASRKPCENGRTSARRLMLNIGTAPTTLRVLSPEAPRGARG